MSTSVVNGLLPALILIIGMMLIITASILFWFQICVADTCFKRPRKTSIFLGIVGWALYLLIMVPAL